MMPKAKIYIYELNSKIVGFAGVENNYIAGIFVKQQNQSKGIGKKLLGRIRQDFVNLSLTVYKKNINAIKFYQKEGFKIQYEQNDENTNEIEYFMDWRL